MMENIYFGKGILPEGGKYGSVSTGIETFSLSKGTSSFQRGNYFYDICHEKIISHNLRVGLVNNIAKLYVSRGVAFYDLNKAGNQGLAHALENFELEGGARFSTYAARCIRHSIERAIMSSRPPRASKIKPPPTISNPHTRHQSVSSIGAKTHHQGA